jgi:hypothetical protein
LWWYIKSDGTQVHFCVRLDAGQDEKEAYEGVGVSALSIFSRKSAAPYIVYKQYDIILEAAVCCCVYAVGWAAVQWWQITRKKKNRMERMSLAYSFFVFIRIGCRDLLPSFISIQQQH